MGIKNFSTLMKKASDGVSNATYNDFAGQSWAIDASIFCYRFAHNAQGKRPNSHIDGFYQLFLRLLKAKIRPVLVFDGKAPKEKKHTLQLRAVQKKKNIEKIDKLEHVLETLTHTQAQASTEGAVVSKAEVQEALSKAKKNVISFQPGFYDDIRMLCSLMNVPIVQAKEEADVMCAKLYTTGQVQAIMSEDSDILLYKGGRLIRKVGWTNDVEVLELDKILPSMGLTHDQFIDLAILCGTDYTNGTIPGLGPLTAFEYILKGLNIEQIIEVLGINAPSGFTYQDARNLITTSVENEQTITVEQFDITKVNYQALEDVLTARCNYRISTVQKHYGLLTVLYGPQRPKIKLSVRVGPPPCSPAV
jgi:flap endonuclease-1